MQNVYFSATREYNMNKYVSLLL